VTPRSCTLVEKAYWVKFSARKVLFLELFEVPNQMNWGEVWRNCERESIWIYWIYCSPLQVWG